MSLELTVEQLTEWVNRLQRELAEARAKLAAAEAENQAWIAKAESWAAIGSPTESCILLDLVAAMASRAACVDAARKERKP